MTVDAERREPRPAIPTPVWGVTSRGGKSTKKTVILLLPLFFDQGDVGGAGRSAKSPVQRRQRQFAPSGNFEIRGVIYREFVLAGQVKQCGFVTIAVHRNG